MTTQSVQFSHSNERIPNKLGSSAIAVQPSRKSTTVVVVTQRPLGSQLPNDHHRPGLTVASWNAARLEKLQRRGKPSLGFPIAVHKPNTSSAATATHTAATGVRSLTQFQPQNSRRIGEAEAIEPPPTPPVPAGALRQTGEQNKMTIKWPFQAHYLLILTHVISASGSPKERLIEIFPRDVGLHRRPLDEQQLQINCSKYILRFSVEEGANRSMAVSSGDGIEVLLLKFGRVCPRNQNRDGGNPCQSGIGAGVLVWILWKILQVAMAQPEITIENEKTVYAIPGSDVTLQCCILKQDGIHVTQTQWSKGDAAPLSRIAIYNPVYGIQYLHFAKMGYSHSVNFSQQCQHHQPDLNSHSHFTANYTECNQWSLQLNNVSLEQAGQYECSFATYPAGIRSSEINLIIKKPDERSSVAEILLNQTLEIPCFKGMNSSILANATLKWLMKGTGNEEILITEQPFYPPGHGTNDTIYKERIHVGPENTLRISHVSILDDSKKFVCYLPGMKSTTEVKVFVKPEIPIVLHTSVTGKATLTCVVRKAFPKPNILWYMDRKILKDNFEGTFLEIQDIKDEEGFHETRSLLTILDTFQPPIPQIFRCMAIYPFPENELRNVSSEEIRLSLDNLSTKRVTDLTSQTVPSSSPTVKGGFNLTDSLTATRATELTSLISPGNSPTVRGSLDSTGVTTNPGPRHFSWPAFIAALLSICSFLMILGIRTWCHYQKEIMNRPPSFKPPPPPVKYTSMQECEGADPPCHVLENL
ncbi:PREDICTED: T-cell surface protein tactile [Gekko japonicus]|uniref:T-cell surface protein tactile n=1 Tax=Gekko japonicus TaxID=146911 RepID=A0ABM1JIZ5_GEKJA|nr:PREDICTED: T-cell surface protein tactile [Gekko japonicus]